MSVLRRFIAVNTRASRRFDQLFPAHLRLQGKTFFEKTLVARHVRQGMTIYDIGGGKRPFFSAKRKRALKLQIVGLDISQDELDLAPKGSYDSTEVSPIGRYQGRGDADLALCNMVLEHVPDTAAALRAMSSIVKIGGTCLIVVPGRNSTFARLNRLLPQEQKQRILFRIFPSAQHGQGFPAYYDRCTPSQFVTMSKAAGFQLLTLNRFWASPYFEFFFPAYVLWRAWTLLMLALRAGDMCETFALALRRVA